MRVITSPGRWVWGVSGLVTVVALAVPGTRLITSAGDPGNQSAYPKPGMVTQTVTVSQPVTRLEVQSYGAPVQVTAGPVRHVQVTETIQGDPQDGGPPAVTQSVSGGRLTLADPACSDSGCSVSFAVTVPPDVSVTAASGGGPVAVSGTAGANLDSGGGLVRATGIHGPLTVSTEGGPLMVNDVTGPLYADTGGGALGLYGLAGPPYANTGGGPLQAGAVAAATATAITGGGEARIGFTTAPDTVMVSTDGGPAALALPGGPYAVTADSDGGPELVGIAADPAARHAITVTTGGGLLQVEPGTQPSASSASSAPGGPPTPPTPPTPPGG